MSKAPRTPWGEIMVVASIVVLLAFLLLQMTGDKSYSERWVGCLNGELVVYGRLFEPANVVDIKGNKILCDPKDYGEER